jgi:hypothetical protein
MSEPNLKTCKQKLPLWLKVKDMNNIPKNIAVPPEYREKCPCILLNMDDIDIGNYFGKLVTKSHCQKNNITTKKNVTNNNSKYNYDKYIGEYTGNDSYNGKPYYYIYVYNSDELLKFITNYKDAAFFAIQETNEYIAVSSYYKDLIKALANALHKQASDEYNSQGNKANNIPLYPVHGAQTAGSRKKVKTHHKNKIISINKKNCKTKKRIFGSK